jgi:flagellar basal body P-ring formation protein FlgA
MALRRRQATYIDAMTDPCALARPTRPRHWQRLRAAAASAFSFAGLAFVTFVALCARVPAAFAEEAALGGALEAQVRRLAADGLPTGAPGAPRIEVIIGQLDARLRLAPCEHVEPYLPEGMRLWGKARIGLRCTQGASKWNVYLPITVKAFGPALVALGGAAAGSVLAAADLALAEVDLAEDASPALPNAELAVGRVLARPLKAGQSLRQSHLKQRQWFAAGDTVNVIAQGAGFSVAGDGQALTNGIEGQPARVRTDSGRVLTGLPVGDRRMEMSL